MKAILSVWVIFYCAIFSLLSRIDCQSVYQRNCIQENKQKCELNYRKHVFVGSATNGDELTPERCCPEFEVRDCLKRVYIDCEAESWFVFEIPTPRCLILDNGKSCDNRSGNDNHKKIVNRGQLNEMNADTGGYTTSTSGDTTVNIYKCNTTGSSLTYASKFIFIFLLIRFIVN